MIHDYTLFVLAPGAKGPVMPSKGIVSMIKVRSLLRVQCIPAYMHDTLNLLVASLTCPKVEVYEGCRLAFEIASLTVRNDEVITLT